jgi:hypothetical protein
MPVFVTTQLGGRELSPSGHVLGAGKIVNVKALQVLKYGTNDRLVLECKDGSRQFYLFFSQLDEGARLINKSWCAAHAAYEKTQRYGDTYERSDALRRVHEIEDLALTHVQGMATLLPPSSSRAPVLRVVK